MISFSKKSNLSSLAGCLGVIPTPAAITGQLTDLATLLAIIAWTFGLSLGMSDPDELLFIALGLLAAQMARQEVDWSFGKLCR